MRVTVDDGISVRLFVPSGDSVSYRKNSVVESRPGWPGMQWPKRVVTTHMLSWETVTYE